MKLRKTKHGAGTKVRVWNFLEQSRLMATYSDNEEVVRLWPSVRALLLEEVPWVNADCALV